jgi:cytochrome c-type biogenesis protein CcmH/NrfG
MKRFFTVLNERFFSSAYQVQRIVIWTAIVLVVALVSFGSYYYYDRYYTAQPTVKEVSLAEAEQAVRDDPQNPETRLKLAEAYMFYGRFEEAISMRCRSNKRIPTTSALTSCSAFPTPTTATPPWRLTLWAGS